MKIEYGILKVVDKEVGIHRCAMPSHPDTGEEKICFAIRIDKWNEIREVNANSIRELRKLVRESNVHVPVRHTRELHHFRRLDRINQMNQIFVEEPLIDFISPVGGFLRYTANHLGSAKKLLQHGAALDSLRTM